MYKTVETVIKLPKPSSGVQQIERFTTVEKIFVEHLSVDPEPKSLVASCDLICALPFRQNFRSRAKIKWSTAY